MGEAHCLILPNGSKQFGIHEFAKGLKSNRGKKVLASALIGDGVFDWGCLVLIDAFSMARSIKWLSTCIRLSLVRFGFAVVSLTSSRGITLKGETLSALSFPFR